ncbi:MAG: collagen-like protein [Amycolatopsis sp.]|jgi:hypothetical protein|uniref:hypothetical protein n=1 Tax=Amycolatopsis sp. TaxID=37632 RepID=UPI00261FBBC8|nr:hypothetical protein [Amycolatopsis sp.]MCU1687789.1 collagen-like protein [Amycolatopsis sp.]
MAPLRFAIRNRVAVIALGIAIISLVLAGWGIVSGSFAHTAAQQAQSDSKSLADPLAALCASDPSVAARVGPANCQKAAEIQQAPIEAAPAPGPPGVGIASVIPGDCSVRIALTDGRVSTLSNLCGAAGVAGKDAPLARGIAATAKDGCNVDITFTDGATSTLGPFCGANGTDGHNGADGVTPPCMSLPAQCQGADGKPGNDGKPGSQGVGVADQRFVLNDSGDCVSRVTYNDPATGTTRVDDTPAGPAACPPATPPSTTVNPPIPTN